MRFAVAAGISFALIVSACGGDDADEGDVTPASQVTAAASPSPAATTGATTLTSSAFTPAVSFDVGEGWAVFEDTPTVFEIQHTEGTPGEQAWIGVFKVSDVRSPDNFSEAQPIPDDIAAWLAANRHLTVESGPTPVTLDGIAASQIDVSTNLGYEPSLFGLAGRPAEEAFVIGYSDDVRFIELQDVEDGTIVIATGALTTGFFNDVLPFIDPVIATIDFE
jgi:hypothetical protein